MSSEKLFDTFYAIPNAHFNAFFEAATGPSSDKHPLAGLAADAGEFCEPGEQAPETDAASE